jgi:hypothetical protein
MDRQRLFELRKANVMPDGATVAASAGGRELVRQRNSGQQQKFPDHASYLRYVRGVNYVRTRNVAPPAPSATVPGAPTSVSASAGNAQATVTFTAPTSNGGATITSYTVTSSPGGVTVTGPASPLTVTGLTNGTAYTFTVVATNSAGSSAPSDASTPVTPVTTPSAPSIISATPGNGQVTVAFTPPISNGGSVITNYKYSTNNGVSWTARAPPSLLSPLLITGLTNGTIYQIKLLAVNTVGDGAASTAASATPATTPAAPTGLSATPGNTQVVISFTPGSDGGSAIINYEYSIDNGATFSEFNPYTGEAVSSVIITGLTNETSYNIKLRAVNDVGKGAPSSTVTSTPSVFTRARFTTVGTSSWTVPSTVTSIEYLVVGGGGGGGGAGGTGSGGGGGGGSVKTGTLSVTPGDVINYTVGAGGTAGVTVNGGGGADSIFGTITAGGGGIGYESRSKNESGILCKGGSTQSGDTPTTGGSGGGTRNNDAGGGPGGGLGGGGGGGGGAGGAGQDGYDLTPGDATSAVGGNGGAGISSDIYGSFTTYGVGGKGGNESFSNITGAAGTPHTGNGGGGAEATSMGGSNVAGGVGGSGVIIIKYVA